MLLQSSIVLRIIDVVRWTLERFGAVLGMRDYFHAVAAAAAAGVKRHVSCPLHGVIRACSLH